jgi:hypothetical protein
MNSDFDIRLDRAAALSFAASAGGIFAVIVVMI